MRTTNITHHNHPRSGTGTMRYIDKSRQQLINELVETRQRLVKLEVADTERKQAEHDLQERVKELQCLYGIAEVAKRPDISSDELYQEVVNLLPSSWQYPEITCARTIIDNKEFKTKNYRDTEWQQSSDIKVYGAKAGTVEVGYLEERPERDEGPFLKQERLLLDAIAKQLARITERMQMERRIEHLNLALRAIRNVNQLIAKEKNRDRLLKGTCDNLVESRGYYDAWVAILDESGSLVTTAEAGLGRKFSLMVERLKRGEFTNCAQRALRQSGIVLIKNPPSTCGDCPLVENYQGRGAMAVRLEHSGKVYGILSVSIPVELIADKEEQALFKEVASDIAFALHNMDLEEKRKQAEEALQESEGKYRALVENATDFIYMHDKDSRILSLNKSVANLFGKAPEELIGKTIFDLFPKEIAARMSESLKRVFETGRTKTDEFKLIAGGKEIWTSTNLSPVKDYKDRVIAVMGVTRDITERMRMDKKARELETLREVDRLRSGLLANVSHELRTPLTSIKGFTTTLLRSDVRWSEEDQQDFLQSIDQETERLIRLINDLLDMSRIEAGGLKLERYNYQIADILDSVNSRLTILTEHHQLQVIVPSELPPVFVDEMRIGQVLTNLVENATKYSPEDSQITIEAQLAGDQIIISVTDTGESIPTEFLDRVFDRFYQAESIVTGRKSGTGLGLPICKGIIESHGGRIWVESKVGKGSNFSFNLPTSKRDEQVA